MQPYSENNSINSSSVDLNLIKLNCLSSKLIFIVVPLSKSKLEEVNGRFLIAIQGSGIS